jgi:hypothetical protein
MHELGHCLGFVDFVRSTTNTTGFINPQRCDDPSKPYEGLMSYCARSRQPSNGFFEDDRKLLILAGFFS